MLRLSVLLAVVFADNNIAYLESNAVKEGVVVLPSGLQYKVLTKGSGERSPAKNETCECHYEGSLPDGSIFDSSRRRGKPSSFRPDQVIAGWTEALQLMKEGDRWQLVIPSTLGYGSRGAGAKIPGGATLIFDLELIRILGASSGVFASLGLPDALDEPITGDTCLPSRALVNGARASLLGPQSGGRPVCPPDCEPA